MSGKLKYVLLSSLTICALSSTAYAGLKFDGTNPITSITEGIGKVQSIASDRMKQVEHTKTLMSMKDGLTEGLNKLKDFKSSVTESINSAMAAKEALTSAAQDLVNVQKLQASSKADYESQVKDLEDKRDASTKKYKDNNAELQKKMAEHPEQKAELQKKIDENNAQIEKINANYQKLIDEKKAVFDNIDKQYTQQLSDLQNAAANVDPLSNVNADSLKKKASGLFSGDSGAALNEALAKNFYADGEEETTKRNGELNNYRRDTALNDAADVYTEAVKIMSAGDEQLIYVKKVQSNTAVTETEDGAVTLDVPIKVENIKALLKYARLLVAELKMATSQDMIGLPKKLNNYSKDVTQFNIDDYQYKEKKKGGLGSLKDLKNQASSLKDSLSETGGALMNTAGSAISAVTEAATTATSTINSVSSSVTETTSGIANSVNDATSMVNDASSMVNDVSSMAKDASSMVY